MNPKTATAWACGTCGKLHPKNEHGKAFAERCCMCPTCNGPSGKWLGSRDIECPQCIAKKNLVYARKHFKQQQEFLADAETAAKRLGVMLDEKE